MKWIETRSWPAPASLIGERIAIHASARVGLPVDAAVAEAMWQTVERPLPLGAVVGSAVLTACVPMVDRLDENDDDRDVLYLADGHAFLWPKGTGIADRVNVSDQLPFGIFEPGRWAYLLADARPLATPIPCRGRQRFWNLPDDIAAEVEAQCRT